MDKKGTPLWLEDLDLPTVATLCVGVSAGVLAAVASRDVAVATGAVNDPALAWLLPIIIEGGSMTSAALAWRRTKRGEGAWPERFALFTLMLLAVWVNVSHVATGHPLGMVLAASPPLVLIGSVEMLLRSKRTVVKRTRKAAHTAKVVSAPEPRTKAQKPTGALEASASAEVAPQQSSKSKNLKLEEVRALLAENPSINGPQTAAALDISDQYARRLLAVVRKEQSQEAA